VGLLDRDSRGYALSLDLLLALIPLTLVLGLVAADMDNLMYQVQDVVYRGSTERVAADTMNTLLTTSGNPNNWEEDVSTLKVPGLAKYDNATNQSIRYYLSDMKVGAITSTQIQNILGSNYGYSLNVSSVISGTQILSRGTRGDASIDPNATEVVREERIVLYAPFDIVSQAVNIRGTGKPIVITGDTFPTNKQYNQLYDYYVYVESTGTTTVTSAWVTINSVTVVKPDDFTAGTTRVVKLIDPHEYGADVLYNETELMDNAVSVKLAGSPTDKMNVYVVKVPKGTPIGEIDLTATTLKYRAVLYVWVR
jgi:hypothetical protein